MTELKNVRINTVSLSDHKENYLEKSRSRHNRMFSKGIDKEGQNLQDGEEFRIRYLLKQ